MPSLACEFHGGYGSPHQFRWGDYNINKTPVDKTNDILNQKNLAVPPVAKIKKKPVFSKAASRASNIAKARIDRKIKNSIKIKTENKTSTPKTTTTP